MKVTPIAEGAVRKCDDGSLLVALLLHDGATLPPCFTPRAWQGAVSRAYDLYLFQRYAR